MASAKVRNATQRCRSCGGPPPWNKQGAEPRGRLIGAVLAIGVRIAHPSTSTRAAPQSAARRPGLARAEPPSRWTPRNACVMLGLVGWSVAMGEIMTTIRLRNPRFLAASTLIVLALGLVVSAPQAQADLITDGTLNFTASSGSPTPSGSFVYDNTTNSVISYTLNWDGARYDITTPLKIISPSITILTQPGNWCATASSFSISFLCTNFHNQTFEDTFALQIPNNIFFAGPIPPIQYISPDAAALGSFTVTTAVAAPEPSALALLGLAIGGLFLFRFQADRRDRRGNHRCARDPGTA